MNLNISSGSPGAPFAAGPLPAALPLELTVPTSVFSATEFLYTGTTPIQTGVAPGTIEAKGPPCSGAWLPTATNFSPGAAITILNHPEYGLTRSRLDGMFDLVVNGRSAYRKI